MGILLAIHVLVTLMLIIVVLVQKTEGGSSLFASSGSGGMFTARGASNIMTKVTWVLASLFLFNCVLMAVLESHKTSEVQSILTENRKVSDDDSEEEEGSSSDEEVSEEE